MHGLSLYEKGSLAYIALDQLYCPRWSYVTEGCDKVFVPEEFIWVSSGRSLNPSCHIASLTIVKSSVAEQFPQSCFELHYFALGFLAMNANHINF